MKLWTLLYVMIWIVFFDFLLALTPIGDRSLLLYGHAVLGALVLALAYVNLTEIRRTQAPDRLKRIARATLSLAAAQPILGILLFLPIPANGISVRGIIEFIHVVVAFAIITQASSVATAYDMWEEKEFLPESAGASSIA